MPRLGSPALEPGTRPQRAALAVLGLAVIAWSCGSPARCAEIAASPDAQQQLIEAQGGVDFALQQPCGYDSRLIVASVHTDLVPGDPPQTRVTFVVVRGDDRAFMLSETRALLAFTAIPQSTRRVALCR